MSHRRTPCTGSRLAAALIAAGLLAAPAAWAQPRAETPGDPAPNTPSEPAFELPDTPAAAALTKLLRFLAKGDVPTLPLPDGVAGPPAPFFTDAGLQRHPLGVTDRRLREQRSFFGGLDIIGLQASGPHEIIALVQGRDDGSGWRLAVRVEREPPHRIDGFGFVLHPAAARAPDLNSWADVQAMFDEFTTQFPTIRYALAVAELPAGAETGAARPLARFGADVRLNVGSAVRWFVLEALADEVDAGPLQWTDAIDLPPDVESFPPQRLSQWPEGEPVNLDMLTAIMMVLRDNTATDVLIHRLGRDAVADAIRRRAGDDPRNTPLLATGEAYRLKIGLRGDLLETFIAADDAAQAALLQDDVPANDVTLEMLAAWAVPQGVDDVGWFASAESIAAMLADLWVRAQAPEQQALAVALFSRAPLPESSPAWRLGAFRADVGEPGVIAAYWLLHRDDDRRFVVALLMNDAESRIPSDPLQPRLVGLVRYLEAFDRPAPAPAPQPDDAEPPAPPNGPDQRQPPNGPAGEP